MIKNEKMADIMLIVTAVIWGTGFIGTEYAIETGAKTSLIIAMRFLIAGGLLGLINYQQVTKINKETFKVGLFAGSLLFMSFYLQTLGQGMTTVSNSSFLTSTNVVMVPFIVWFFTKKRPSNKYFILGATAFLGAGILTWNFVEGFSFKIGDILVVMSAMGFACHIAYLGIYGKDKNSVQLTFLQMAIAGILAFIFMVVFDKEAMDVEIVFKALPSVTFLAVFCSCICYYFQTTAQQFTSPSKASIFLCTEGLFGSIFAVILGIDNLTIQLIIGGIVILSSVILAEVDINWTKKRS